MQIVIDIPEDRYKWIKQRVKENKNEPTHLPMEYDLIANGTPLPKGHGRLIDADDVDNHIIGSVNLRDCPTIIKADKAESEGKE